MISKRQNHSVCAVRTAVRRALAIVFAACVPFSAAPIHADPALIDAALRGEARAVSELIAAGSDVDSPAADGSTALHHVVDAGNLELAELLLAAGASPGARTRNDVTPLALAALNGDADMIELLLASGADANALSSEGESALMLAALNGRPSAVSTLLEHGADPNLREPFRGQTALMWAAAGGNREAVSLLLEAGAELEAKSSAGYTALLFAVRNGELPPLETLIAAGANVNALAPDETSALNVAVLNGYFDVASVLLQHGADPNLPDRRGGPLHIISWIREPGATGNAAVGAEADAPIRASGSVTSLELVAELLEAGADPNARIQWDEGRFSKIGGTARNPPGLVLGRHLLTFNGATAFYVAAKNGDAPLMRILADGGADPTMPNDFGVTPLMVAAGLDTWEGETPGPHTGVSEEERLEAVKLAVELGNDVNAVADFGDFAMLGDPEYTLLYYPLNIDDYADAGAGDLRWDESTALHGSVISNQPSITRYLIEQGADPAPVNALGWTPLMMSRGVFLANASREYPEIEEILLEALAESNGE